MSDESPISQLDRVVSAQILGAIIFGKFAGDLVDLYLRDVFGSPDAKVAGMILGLGFMLFWPSIERTYQRWYSWAWEDQNGSD